MCSMDFNGESGDVVMFFQETATGSPSHFRKFQPDFGLRLHTKKAAKGMGSPICISDHWHWTKMKSLIVEARNFQN